MLWQNDGEDKECKFDLLNDNCCIDILRRLPLVDLCALSRTCIRLYNLCNKQFQLEYPSKVMYIDGVDDNGDFIKGPSQEKYVDAFDKSIQNIVLRGKPLASKLDVVNAYYNQDESVNDRPVPVKQIQLVEWEEDEFIDAGRKLADLLKNVETIVFDYVWIEADWFDTFLQYTPNIKRLEVLYRCIFDQRQHWLENVYPQLESLECYAESEMLADKLNTFLRLNPNVRHVSLYAEWAESVTDWIENDVKVDELFFYVHTGSMTGMIEFEYDFEFLELRLKAVAELIKAQNTNLHLMIGSERDESVSEEKLIAELTSLQSNIVGIYFPGIKISEKLATAISAFENVRVLLLRACENNGLIAKMAKLEEVYFDRNWIAEEFADMYDTMRTLVGGAAKLKKIYVRNNHIPFTKFDFANLDQERVKLNGACKLKIYVNSVENDDTGKLDDAERPFNRIEVIRTSTEPTGNPHLARLENMFFRPTGCGGGASMITARDFYGSLKSK